MDQKRPPKLKNMPKPPTEKVKILCLHGYRQNAESFKSKLGSFRKISSKYADLNFVEAPHIAPPITEEDNADGTSMKGWWFNKDDGTFKGTNQNGPAFGFEESLKLVEKAWSEDNYQGLLGFSQGSCFVGIICGLAARGLTSIKPKFTIQASGFPSGSLAHRNCYDNKIELPLHNLFIYGESDEIITKDMTIKLQEYFEHSETLVHPGGHFFAATAQQKPVYIDFLRDRLLEHLEELEIKNASEMNSVVVNGDD